MATFDSQGRQVPDPRPVEVPAGLGRPLSLHDEIKRFVRMELSRAAQAQALETFEENDDFDVEDEEELPLSDYEVREMAAEPGDRDADPPPAPNGADRKAPAPASSAVSGGSGEEPPVK